MKFKLFIKIPKDAFDKLVKEMMGMDCYNGRHKK